MSAGEEALEEEGKLDLLMRAGEYITDVFPSSARAYRVLARFYSPFPLRFKCLPCRLSIL